MGRRRRLVKPALCRASLVAAGPAAPPAARNAKVRMRRDDGGIKAGSKWDNAGFGGMKWDIAGMEWDKTGRSETRRDEVG